jgi:hypothetical protein
MKGTKRLNDELDTEYNEIMDRETEDNVAGETFGEFGARMCPPRDGDSRNLAHNLRDLKCLDRGYFEETVETDGISGDDVNRRLREARLGFKAPSEDWEQCGTVIHCIYPDQVPTKSHESIIMWMGVGLRAPVGFVACEKVNIVNPVMVDETLYYRGLPVIEHKFDGAHVAFVQPEPESIVVKDADLDCNNCKHKDLLISDSPCVTCGNYADEYSAWTDPDIPVLDEPEDICKTCTTKCSGCDTTGNTGNCSACEDNHCNICTDGNMHQDAEDICIEKSESDKKSYSVESAFARVAGVYEGAYKRWAGECRPVCEHNDDDDYCDHMDNHVCECLFNNCPRVCSNN